MERIIFHIDVNNAFLSWTALDLLNKGYQYDIRDSYANINADKRKWGYRMGNYSSGVLLYCSPYTGTFPTFPHEWTFLAGFENGAVRSLQNISRLAYTKWNGSYGLTNGDQLFFLMQYISEPIKTVANSGMWYNR